MTLFSPGFLVTGRERGVPMFVGGLSWAQTVTGTSANRGSARENGVCPGSQPLSAQGPQLQSPQAPLTLLVSWWLLVSPETQILPGSALGSQPWSLEGSRP